MHRWPIFLPAAAGIALLWEPELQRWLPQPPQERPATYDPDHFRTQPADLLRRSAAFVSRFDGVDDDTGTDVPDALGSQPRSRT